MHVFMKGINVADKHSLCSCITAVTITVSAYENYSLDDNTVTNTHTHANTQ